MVNRITKFILFFHNEIFDSILCEIIINVFFLLTISKILTKKHCIFTSGMMMWCFNITHVFFMPYLPLIKIYLSLSSHFHSPKKHYLSLHRHNFSLRHRNTCSWFVLSRIIWPIFRQGGLKFLPVSIIFIPVGFIFLPVAFIFLRGPVFLSCYSFPIIFLFLTSSNHHS